MTGIHSLVLGLLLFGCGLMLVPYTGALRRPTADENQGINLEGRASASASKLIARKRRMKPRSCFLPPSNAYSRQFSGVGIAITPPSRGKEKFVCKKSHHTFGMTIRRKKPRTFTSLSSKTPDRRTSPQFTTPLQVRWTS